MKSAPAISVVMPCWNAGRYLARGLDSLLGQTLRELEIICVDDGSTDDTLKILRAYADKDARVKVVALAERGGASAARNAGMKIAVGEYIGFLDSDDYVDLDFYATLWEAARSAKAEIVKGKAKVDCNGKIKNWGSSHRKIRANRAYFNHTFWSAIYQRAFLEKQGIEFPPGIIIAQDVVFLLKAVMLARRIELAEADSHYFYLRREGSLDSGPLNEAKIKTNIAAFEMMVDFLNSVEIEREVYSKAFCLIMNYLLGNMSMRSKAVRMRMLIIEAAMEIFKKCKYQNDYLKNNMIYGELLKKEDEINLFSELSNRKCNTIFKLFGCIPILKIVNKRENKRWRLFYKLTLLSKQLVKYGDNSVALYKLFGIIPFFTRVDERRA